MTATPPQPIIPQHYFRTLCQNPSCRTPTGGFVPQPGLKVIFACQRCQHVTVFHSEASNISSFLFDRHGRQIQPPPASPAKP